MATSGGSSRRIRSASAKLVARTTSTSHGARCDTRHPIKSEPSTRSSFVIVVEKMACKRCTTVNTPRCFSHGLWFLETEFLQTVSELVAGDAQELCCAGLVVAGGDHGAVHHLAFDFFERDDACRQRYG